MTNGLNNGQMKIINILAWVIITVMLGYGAWLGNKFYDLKEALPQEYVRLERYSCDIEDLKIGSRLHYNELREQNREIQRKLDRLIERQTKNVGGKNE